MGKNNWGKNENKFRKKNNLKIQRKSERKVEHELRTN